ncbi:MAG: hydrogenase nickel incorporation protein HypB [Chthonomonadales bacterium]|nr:hydrogenase nickel incorporation protein HypB [Chthonomonadales bacterium]
MVRRTVDVSRPVLERNESLADANRRRFRAAGLFVVNVLSSPGSGKTALLERTLADLSADLPCGVVVGDLATDNDARRLTAGGGRAVQITTGDVCHLDAAMVAQAVDRLGTEGLRVLFIENVGNLVCPGSYDLGEGARAVLLSVTEGEDKPLKYPAMFKSADVVIVTKTDIAGAVGYDRAAALANIQGVAPQAAVMELSARTGAGVSAWYDYLRTGSGARGPDDAR